MPHTHALLVGIDRYPQLPPGSDLPSCANDVARMSLVLREAFGFQAEDLAVLLNEHATRKGILAGLAALRDRAAPGDVALFYYSGHGSHLQDSSTERPDDWSRSIVPHDARKKNRGAPMTGDIPAETLYDWLEETSRKTPNVVLIADTCYSTGLLRDDPWAVEKSLPPVVVPREQRPPSPFSRPPAASGLRSFGLPGERGPGETYVFLAACDRKETATILTRRGYSTFTYHLCDALRSLRPQATYRDLWVQLLSAMSGAQVRQTPSLEGARDLEVFGGTFRRPDPFLPVLAREGNRVVLGGGEMHGVGAGSVWGLHPPGTLQAADAAPPVRLRIDQVEPDRSTGEVEAGAGDGTEVGAGWRAFELAKGPGGRRLAVWIDDAPALAPEERAALAATLRESPLLLVAEQPSEADLSLALGSADGSGVLGWRVNGPEGRALLQPILQTEGATGDLLRRKLERFARAHNLLALEPRSDGERALAGHLKVEIGLRGPTGELVPLPKDPATGRKIVPEGAPLALQLRHDAPFPLHLHVLDVGQTGGCSLLYPPPGGNKPCQAGYLVRVDQALTGTLRLGLPRDFPPDRTGGPEVFKIFATTSHQDLSVWESSNLRGERPVAAAPQSLQAEIAEACGVRVSALRDGPAEAPPAPWTVLTVNLWVERGSRT